jgi:WhiB family redox-sensing transcriptional regulator
VRCRSGETNDHELLARVYRQARCATSCLDPDEWFPLTEDLAQAREQAARAIAVCAECPVRAECLELSLRPSFGIGAHGVWGGLVAAERRQLRRRWLAAVLTR